MQQYSSWFGTAPISLETHRTQAELAILDYVVLALFEADQPTPVGAVVERLKGVGHLAKSETAATLKKWVSLGGMSPLLILPEDTWGLDLNSWRLQSILIRSGVMSVKAGGDRWKGLLPASRTYLPAFQDLPQCDRVALTKLSSQLVDWSLVAPVKVVPSDADWAACCTALGVDLPVDYYFLQKMLGGANCLNQALIVYSIAGDPSILSEIDEAHSWNGGPNHSFAGKSTSFTDAMDIFPAPGGLLPVGHTINGDSIWWRVKGPPEEWSIFVQETRSPEYQEFRGSLATFLERLVSGSLKIEFFPDEIRGARRK